MTLELLHGLVSGQIGWFGIPLCISVKCIHHSFICILINPEGFSVAKCDFRIDIICTVIFNLCFGIVTFGHNI